MEYVDVYKQKYNGNGITQFDFITFVFETKGHSIAFIIEIQYHSKKRFHHLYNRYTNGLLVYFISDTSVFHFKDVEPTLFLYLVFVV